jgi:hypothetical protein
MQIPKNKPDFQCGSCERKNITAASDPPTLYTRRCIESGNSVDDFHSGNHPPSVARPINAIPDQKRIDDIAAFVSKSSQ